MCHKLNMDYLNAQGWCLQNMVIPSYPTSHVPPKSETYTVTCKQYVSFGQTGTSLLM